MLAMPYVISEKCVGVCDQACVDACPADCIHGPIAGQMVIDPDACTECGACLPVCPVDAIYIADDRDKPR